ncbi:DUF3891 family protein [Paenibacillus mucilaginosus]|uniref:DUF3891 family protein n=2 Tax=Paenibacillus mucilaginosus TaxID=61624 RepID=H6NKE7_9BACL|nr:DUF3891 family protein [Paenibacillus mucilaginosus]AEI42741.1 hypothetical protein KNP414_04209 [Paenibacillus mucilaginosus KNP414]AFC32338.1 hypothetical protein PM3016_5650 [Paenibacillus mucilaginosus 3016]MCG7217017.1 DUF3891 family protein [Paenibacillus mucilaginosus]WDM26117.1 DUF3891 family protein [Paenibacillus mucilaginosus]WFA22736.1 DUF3891 family protein [Paenibacillus mucilaginosus]
MIVRDTGDAWVLTAQHEHARLSGDAARRFRPFFEGDPHFEDLVTAVYQHDLGWVRLDETPVWNDRASAPYSFIDYPLLPKLTHYRLGLDQVEELNPYAALLCSMHYAAFVEGSTDEESSAFHRYETGRQERIRKELGIPGAKELQKPFSLLKLCDRISLYVTLNEPGAGKEQEYPPYRTGFGQSESFHPDGSGILAARWISKSEIEMAPNPFEHTFRTSVRQKRVPKALAGEIGLAEAYRRTEETEQEVVFHGRTGEEEA